jgi:hypothetical protein
MHTSRSGHQKSEQYLTYSLRAKTASTQWINSPRVRSSDRRGSRLGERKFNGLLATLNPVPLRCELLVRGPLPGYYSKLDVFSTTSTPYIRIEPLHQRASEASFPLALSNNPEERWQRSVTKKRPEVFIFGLCTLRRYMKVDFTGCLRCAETERPDQDRCGAIHDKNRRVLPQNAFSSGVVRADRL